MPGRKSLQIDADVHQKVSEQAELADSKLKEYAEASMMFFASRGINPLTYKPRMEFDIIQTQKKSTDKIISFIKHQEQTLLQKITEEVVRGRLYQDALIVLLVDHIIDPNLREEKLKEIVDYVENMMKTNKNL